MGKTIVHVGPGGRRPGRRRSATRSSSAVVIEAVSEALVLGAKAGVDPARIADVLQGGLAATKVLEMRRDNILGGRFDPGFRIRLHLKDLKNALDLARETGVALPAPPRSSSSCAGADRRPGRVRPFRARDRPRGPGRVPRVRRGRARPRAAGDRPDRRRPQPPRASPPAGAPSESGTVRPRPQASGPQMKSGRSGRCVARQAGRSAAVAGSRPSARASTNQASISAKRSHARKSRPVASPPARGGCPWPRRCRRGARRSGRSTRRR